MHFYPQTAQAHDCSICQETLRENVWAHQDPANKKQFICFFHARCVKKWVAMKGNCPSCRVQIVSGSLFTKSEQVVNSFKWFWDTKKIHVIAVLGLIAGRALYTNMEESDAGYLNAIGIGVLIGISQEYMKFEDPEVSLSLLVNGLGLTVCEVGTIHIVARAVCQGIIKYNQNMGDKCLEGIQSFQTLKGVMGMSDVVLGSIITQSAVWGIKSLWNSYNKECGKMEVNPSKKTET